MENQNLKHNELDDEAVVYALNACGNHMLPMVLKAAIELGVFEIIKNTGNGAHISPSKIASHFPSNCSKEGVRVLDSMLRYLATHSFLTCSTRNVVDGETETFYGLAPAACCFVGDESGLSLVPFHAYTVKAAGKLDFWHNLKDAVFGEGTLFDRIHRSSFYKYATSDEGYNEVFNEAMGAHSVIHMKKILVTYKGFEGLSSLVNVGGGYGVCLDMIINMYPSIQGINFDLPQVIQTAPSYNGIEQIGGDMFHEVPKGDAILLKLILHNWSDDQCVNLLKNCYESLPNKGKTIVMDSILPRVPHSDTYAKYASNMDLIMLTMYGGKERTENEFETLAKKAGFEEFKVVCCVYGMSIMEFIKLE